MKQINLTIATDIRGMGGIATVLNVYEKSGFFERWNVKLIATHTTNKKFGGINIAFLFFLALIKIVYYFIFFKVGLVHVHMASRGSFIRKSLVVDLVKILGGKVILHLHGGEFRDFYSQECDKKKQNKIRNIFEKSDLVIVLSSQWISWMKGVLEQSDHVRVLYNGVPSLQLDRSNIESGLVVFLGQIGKRKGTLDLIRAFVQVAQACPEARLALGGDGEVAQYQEEVKRLGLESKVSFLGWVSGGEKDALLAQADVYCLPSYNEGFPMGVLEAMSAGIPVVSTIVGGIPDAIANGEEGILIEPGDIDKLAESIIRLIKNRDLNSQFSAAAKNKFEHSFSTDAVMPQLDDIYKNLLEGHVDEKSTDADYM